MRTMMRRVVVALTFAAGAAASAQSEAPRDVETTNWVVRDDGHVYRIEVKDGKILGEVDGKPLDERRLRREGNVLRILDDRDQTVHVVRTNPGAGQPRVWVGEDGRVVEVAPDQDVRFFAQGAEPQQRVRLGVSISEPDPALAAQLGLGEGEGVLIEFVNDDSAAKKAGLRAFDVIIRIEGQDRATAEALRAALAKKRPGDVIELGVARGGRTLDVKAALTATSEPFGEAGNQFQWQLDGHEMSAKQKAELERALAQSMAQVREQVRVGADQAREMAARLHEELAVHHEAWAEAREGLAEAWEELKSELTEEQKEKIHEAFESVREALEELEIDVDMPQIRIFTGEDDERRAIVAPAAPTPPRAPRSANAPAVLRELQARSATVDVERRLNSIEDRMSRIEALLERLAEQQKSGNR